MKVAFLIVALLPLLVQPKPASTALDDVEIVDVVPAITKDADAVDRADLLRAKRSGFNLVSGLKSTLLSGIGRASASLAASSAGTASSSLAMHSSGGSSSGGSSSGHSYEKPHEDTHFDGWSLKKSILNTLFQAVKAITGGVTILKGQLIKGSGYAISGLGKVVASGGDAVSNVGKKITSSAHLVPAPSHSSVIHPFAKLSGSLSSGSSSLISSASSSSSGGSSSSSSSSGHHTGPSSESFTSYEGPSSYDTHSSSHSYIPPKQSAHYKAPLTSYGTEIESDVYPSAPHYTSGKTSVVEASDVLRQILNQKVQSHQPTSTGYNYNSYHHATGPMKYEKPKAITQYDIPNDPFPPPFKPLKNNNNAYLPPLYGAPHGPIESVTHSQSVVTSFGAPFNGGHYVESESEPPYPPSYDIYRSMSVKMAGKKEKIVTHSSHHPQQSSHPDPRSKVTYHHHPSSGTSSTSSLSSYLSPPKPTALTGDQKRYRDEHHHSHSDDSDGSVHEQQLHDLSQKLGPGIEVQKSLTYEITDPVDVAELTHHIASHDLERRSDDDKESKTVVTVTTATSASSASSKSDQQQQKKKTAT